VSPGKSISFCLRNTGRRSLEVYGNGGKANPGSVAYLRGKPIDYDLDLRFLRPDDTSLLGSTGDVVSRAALFRGEWVGPWAAWLVLVLLLTAFPISLYRALRGVSD
jgi:hypothetical protein